MFFSEKTDLAFPTSKAAPRNGARKKKLPLVKKWPNFTYSSVKKIFRTGFLVKKLK